MVTVGAHGAEGHSPPAPYPYRHTLLGRGVPGVTDVIDDLGLRGDLSMVPPEVLRAAAERGAEVHEEIASRLRGSSPGRVSSVAAPYVEAWERWAEAARPEPAYIEKTLSNPGQGYPYGATVDFVGVTAAGPRIIDWKTRGGHRNDGLQTAPYEWALRVGSTGEELGPDWAPVRQVVELRSSGTYKIHLHSSQMDRRHFCAALITWHLRVANGWVPEKL